MRISLGMDEEFMLWVFAIMEDGNFEDAGDGGWVVPSEGHLVR
jgi:hypothetical protein